ncbi:MULTISPECIES: bifunctional 2-polyprenyl-6-hydroxyphenol methylase/3-demethylubiquinol 3-O-methyltransferase UbiG [Microbacterium]|uniref:class I SAM-dependent methyltransferase n=1 Tax=Microbacterium TaxID=33882 RepID=UPI001E628180|nr:class I SAM-dependent methyltransferase [Microbacterium nymphoidis]MCD2497372.1 class I SAM-dependent methyltransferase [Microbacterium nymphoidis]
MTDPFSEKLQAWQQYTRTPWARIRYAVVAEILRREASTLGAGLRVLDVGGGDGMDALPLARAGHDVTIVDPSESWLAEAQRRARAEATTISTIRGGLDDLPEGEWDLVLCHFVLRYRPADGGDIPALARRVRRGGRLSVMDVNPAGRVLRTVVSDGPAAAMAELQADTLAVHTFNTEVRKVEADRISDEARAAGLVQVGHYGNRIANDLLVDDLPKHDESYFDDLLALELELSGREPFNRIGFAWQLVFAR